MLAVAVPTRLLSRAWGRLHGLALPACLRAPLLGLFVWAFHVDMAEAEEGDLRRYPNLGELFRRPLRAGARPISRRHSLVSPADGRVLHLGRVGPDGLLEQVKGVTYSLDAFLGPRGSLDSGQPTHPGSGERLSVSPGHELFHCVVYLAPGDYHHFHSPAQWTLQHRRHFPGLLVPVSPRVSRRLPGLYCLNERVVLTGRWAHGFLALAAVGATNVGSIRVYTDQ
uniref:phosphatidylserine decarboxylase n=1 Tax=Petromyzon marinus TaxID=7757 RepID=A0AAJ7UKK9_PETMA